MVVDAEHCYNKTSTPVASIDAAGVVCQVADDRQRFDGCAKVAMTIAKLEAGGRQLDRGRDVIPAV